MMNQYPLDLAKEFRDGYHDELARTTDNGNNLLCKYMSST